MRLQKLITVAIFASLAISQAAHAGSYLLRCTPESSDSANKSAFSMIQVKFTANDKVTDINDINLIYEPTYSDWKFADKVMKESDRTAALHQLSVATNQSDYRLLVYGVRKRDGQIRIDMNTYSSKKPADITIVIKKDKFFDGEMPAELIIQTENPTVHVDAVCKGSSAGAGRNRVMKRAKK